MDIKLKNRIRQSFYSPRKRKRDFNWNLDAVDEIEKALDRIVRGIK